MPINIGILLFARLTSITKILGLVNFTSTIISHVWDKWGLFTFFWLNKSAGSCAGGGLAAVTSISWLSLEGGERYRWV